MITDKEIEAKAEELSIPPNHVEKDYVHSWVLWAIGQRPNLRNLLVLKGGNALRKGYYSDTRFSKDLDFSSTDHIDHDFLYSELNEICKLVGNMTGVKFLDETLVKDKDLPIENVEALEARLYFKGFYNEENLTLKTQLDVTQFDRILLPIQERRILHGYSDAEYCNGTILCQKAEEILASKLTTLLHRRKPGDLFDLLYSVLIKGTNDINRTEVITTFLKKSIFEPRPEEARRELLAIPMDDYKTSWAGLLVPAVSIFAFDFVLDNFKSLINALFGAIASTAAFVSGPSIGGGGGFTAIPIRDFSFCPGDVRSRILEAGRSRRMIEMTYDGYQRLVEPYRLEYYVRKSDGAGNEYFWGWDNSGGKSRKTGIKMFFCDKIRNVSITGRDYEPRYPVEM